MHAHFSLSRHSRRPAAPDGGEEGEGGKSARAGAGAGSARPGRRTMDDLLPFGVQVSRGAGWWCSSLVFVHWMLLPARKRKVPADMPECPDMLFGLILSLPVPIIMLA